MNREDIIRMAREAGAMFDHMTWVERDLAPVFERFAALVAAAERERIIAANAPEIEKVNAHIKALEDALAQAKAEEREAIAQSLDKQADLAPDEIDRQWAQEMAAAVRARSQQ